MKIRNRLTFLFTLIFAVITLFSSLAIYFFSSTFRKGQFVDRLQHSALNTARFRFEVKEIDSTLLRIIDRNTLALVDEQTLVFDRQGKIVYNTREGKNPEIPGYLLDRIWSERQIHFKHGEKDGVGILYGREPNQYALVATAHDKYGLSKLYYLRITLFGVSLAAILITALAGWAYSGQALRPISNIIDEVEHISETNLSARIDEGNRKDELAHLAITFNRMLARLEEAFRMQRSFVSYASHELRTPLTAINTQLEVALEKERDTAYYKNLTASVLDDIRQLSALSNGLLNLANASFDVAGLHFEKLRIDELLWQVRDEILKASPECHINIDYAEPTDEENRLVVTGNEQLLKVAIANLIDNACKYSADKQVDIHIHTGQEGIRLDFNDRGIGIGYDEIAQVLTPFYRGKNASAVKGHGLGLSLTQRIIRMHEGAIDIQPNMPVGTSIRVTLPVAA